MSKGTIVYIGGFELPDKNAAAHRVLSNAKILRKLGYKVVFIDVDRALELSSDIFMTKKLIHEFECWSLRYPQKSKEWIKYLTNIDSIKKVIEQYKDVKAVIAYNFQAVALLKLKSYCTKKSIKIIADCTEWYSTKGENMLFMILKGFDSFLRMRIIQKRLNGLIVISQYLDDYYKKYCEIIKIPPLIDLNEGKWGIIPHPIDNGKIRFIYAGSPGKNKDKLNYLLEILYEIKEYENYIFNIVGITKEQYINNYKEHEEILDILGEKVNFIGRLSHYECIEYIKISDYNIFVRENTRLTMAGFPTKFVESVSCGIPVITTRTSDLENYIVEGENGYFIDIYHKENTVLVLKKILQSSNIEINEMKKKYLESSTFHYENYIDQMDYFIKKISN